ncbi:MAG: MBL fold metallo-hydrolase [Acidobacteriia bacterium]|nr:MBL fold metallo-hydrolase [Terriglobia bacterium]
MSKAGIHGNIALCFILFATGAALCLARQQPLTVQQIKGTIYMVKGGAGANTGFYIGDKEVMIIDSKMTADAVKQEIAEIKKLTDKPITRIVLTHSDGDHVNGLNALPTGLKIYAHPQTKKDMEEAAKSPNTQYLRDYLPNEVCSPCAASKNSVMGVKLGGEDVSIYHFGPAHTSGDLVVFFPAERVAFIGDLAFVGRDPLIHRQKGGTSVGYVNTLKSLIALKAEVFISGHNDPLTSQDLQTLATSIEEKQNKVKAMIAEGKSLDDIKKAFGLQTAAASSGRTSFPSLIDVIYLELTEKK